MDIRFLGATGTVTGSRYLVSSGASRLLVDCGLFQGYKALRLRNWAPPTIEPAAIDAVVLTHAHLDHSGYLPLLARLGFRGKIFCTEATYELCRILLPDSGFLQEEQAAHANRHRYSKHAPALPLYTLAEARAVLSQFAPVPFSHPWSPAAGVEARFEPAGHILGAASVSLAAEGATCVFSGDLGRPDDPVMFPPRRISHADAVVMESTYGGRIHDARDPEAELEAVVNATAARGGVVVIPAFAVGRAQALLLHLARLKEARRIPSGMPVYLDSPMAASVTDIYLRCPGEHRLSARDCESIAQVARFVRTADESRALATSRWPMVIIAGSGMATGGRVLHHLKRLAPDHRNTLLFAGYQAPGTRGGDLVRGVDAVKIHGEWVAVRAEVRNLDSLSAHADEAQLVDWLRGFERPPGRIFLTHGEPEAADALRKRIARELGWASEVPEYQDSVAVRLP